MYQRYYIIVMVSNESDELKTLHIEEQLSIFGNELQEELIDIINNRKLVNSGRLRNSFSFDVNTDKDKSVLKFKFKDYGRFVDIQGYSRDKTVVNTNRDLWGIRENNGKKRRKRWYASNMYGGLNRLIGRVMYGLSDQEITRLKKILENRKNTQNI